MREQYERSIGFSQEVIKNIDNSDYIDYKEEVLGDNKNVFKVTSHLLQNVQSDENEDEVMTLYAKNEKEIFNFQDKDENFDLPNDKAWGKQKKGYYYTDYIDPDYASTSQKDIDDAEMEEQDAQNLQNRLATTLDESDFGLDLFDIKKNYYNFDKNYEQIKTDLNNLSKKDKYEFLKKVNPELVPLILDFKECLTEAKMVLKPLLDSINNSNYRECSIKGESVVSHPIIKRLAQYRHLLAQIQENQGNLKQNLNTALKLNNGVKSLKCSANIEKTNFGEIVKSYKTAEIFKNNSFQNIIQNKLTKNVSKIYNDIYTIESKEDIESTNINECEIERDKRSITYQIAKNRGLTSYRKKERNPRVKHRNKYRKAIICRKGAVRGIRKETCRYGGELFGIKASILKSIKLK